MRRLSVWTGRTVCLLLVLCLVGCGDGQTDIVEAAHNELAASTTDTAEETQAPEESAAPEEPAQLEDSAEVETVEELLGTTEDGVYTNEFLGIGCQLPADWTYYSEEEIMELNRTVLEVLSDLDSDTYDPEALEDQELTDMFATGPNGADNVNVAISKLNMIAALALSEEDIAEAAEENILGMYEQMGVTGCTSEMSVYSALGEDHPLLRIMMPLDDQVTMYQTAVIVKKGTYYGIITVTSPGEDISDEALSWFYGLD